MGIENLICAMQDIVKSLTDIYLIIGGTGPLRNELITMTRRLKLDQYIHFTGFIPEEVLPAYYQAADLFVLPTIELEGFGLVTLEALASGTPVLGTPIGGTLDILGTFDSRFLFRDVSPESIAATITEICLGYRNEADKWRSDSLRCRHFVEENYSWEKNIDATERLLFEI
jgi:glycosyltransferase involved in cell wall biosynthesis